MALYNNSRWDFTFKISNDSGEAQDISGRNFVMSLKSELRAENTSLVLTTQEGTLIIGDEGELRVSAPYRRIKDLQQGEYYFDLVELVDADQSMVAVGTLYVNSGVTRT